MLYIADYENFIQELRDRPKYQFPELPAPFFIDALYDDRHSHMFQGDVVDALPFSLWTIDLSDWTALLCTDDGLNWWQHDCGLEITQETWNRAGLDIGEVVCPRCQPEYQYVWTHREGLSR